MYYTKFKTSLCEITLVGNEEGLREVFLHTKESKKKNIKIFDDWKEDKDFFNIVISQLSEYAEGKRKSFHIKINPQGTQFQKRVWKALCDIPYGETRTYKEIAEAVGNPKASRAVGMANSKNPITLIVPCHRIIGANGKLVGFGSGLKIKEKLLRLEGSFHE